MKYVDCPNCGANVPDDRCRFCGTEISVSHRQALEREREWDARIAEASKRGWEDYVLPPIGCCGIYFGLFVVGSLLLGALGLKGEKDYGLVVAAIAIGAALLGAVVIIWRRETRRRQRVVELERDRLRE